MKRWVQYVLLILLATHFVWRGIVPALTSMNTDFPNYYISAKLVLESNTARFYDDNWFQHQIQVHGINQAGRFSPYPPITAFLMLPLATIEPLSALQLWTLLNLGCLIWCIALLTKITKKDLVWCSLIFLASGHALVNNFRFGQFYLIITFLLLWTFVLWRRYRYTTAGVLLGIGIAVKYFPLVFLPLHAFRKESKIVLASLLITVALYLISIAVFGLELHRQFVQSVFLPHLGGLIQDPFSSTFQSWNSLLGRLFVYDPQLNPQPLHQMSILKVILLLALCLVVGGLTVRGVFLAQKTDSYHLQYALVGIAGLLLLPTSATYHFLLLILPVALLLSSTQKWGIEEKIILTSFVAIGFIPYSFVHQFEGQGILVALSYPRLWLMTAMFVATVLLVRKRCTRKEVRPLSALFPLKGRTSSPEKDYRTEQLP